MIAYSTQATSNTSATFSDIPVDRNWKNTSPKSFAASNRNPMGTRRDKTKQQELSQQQLDEAAELAAVGHPIASKEALVYVPSSLCAVFS